MAKNRQYHGADRENEEAIRLPTQYRGRRVGKATAAEYVDDRRSKEDIDKAGAGDPAEGEQGDVGGVKHTN